MRPFKGLFISYGRRESLGFVARLHQKLKLAGYDAWFDKVNIFDGEDYAARINHGIESAHNFVYVMAPRSLCSPYCLIEIEYARVLGKRVIPINHMVIFQTPDKDLSEADKQVLQNFYTAHGIENPNIETVQQVLDRSLAVVGRTDWLDSKEKLSDEDCHQLATWAQAYENHWHKHEDLAYLQSLVLPVFGECVDLLESSVERLILVLERHKAYVAHHTKVLNQALNWSRNQLANHYLLVGKERQAAEAWLLKPFKDGEQAPCEPNALLCDFICESRKNGENRMTDCFICYAHADAVVRDKVVQALSRHAITTWQHDKDIDKGKDYARAIEEGIEAADNFLFFISPDALQSEYCQKELAHAVQLNKRIVPLLIHKAAQSYIPVELRTLQYVDCTHNQTQRDYDANIAQVLNLLQQDAEYYAHHKIWLVRALKWQHEHQKASFLLRGHNLENAKTWLRLNEQRAQHAPLAVHRELIQTSEAAKGQFNTEVFISYSRKDGDFARKLNLALQEAGKTVWFDQESIASGVDFEAELYKGIDGSDNFVFVLSPDSVESEYCEAEVQYALSHNKRIITVLARETHPSSLPEGLQKIHWIDFQGDFTAAFLQLTLGLDVDREHVAAHTRLLQQAVTWDNKQRGRDLLLTGSELSQAENWLNEAEQCRKQPTPVPLQRAYLKAGQQRLKRQALWRFAFVNFTVLLITASSALLVYFTMNTASEVAGNTAFKQTVAHLKTIRDNKKRELETYFHHLKWQLQYFVKTPETRRMMHEFKQAFPHYLAEHSNANVTEHTMHTALQTYYNHDFKQEYEDINAALPTRNTDDLLKQLSPNALALQYAYIAANPNPLGVKEELDTAHDETRYSDVHQMYHPSLLSYTKVYHFTDLFLVDIDTGNILYSVLKQVDFATSLRQGAYADSGLGKAFKQASRLTKPKAITFIDYAPYFPAYEQHFAFIAAPIFDGQQKIGVAIFQLSIEPINDIMSPNLFWSRNEYGRGGEVVLLGEDLTLRSDSRFLIENPDQYLQQIEQAGILSTAHIKKIRQRHSTVGIQKIDNSLVKAALHGVIGFDAFEDYRGEFVLSAFAPVDALGVNWVILSNFPEDESLEQVNVLTHKIQKQAHIFVIPPFILLGMYYLYLLGLFLYRKRQKHIAL